MGEGGREEGEGGKRERIKRVKDHSIGAKLEGERFVYQESINSFMCMCPGQQRGVKGQSVSADRHASTRSSDTQTAH